MTDCCSDAACSLDATQAQQRTTLRLVLGINAGMFVVELVAGLLAASVALVADSLDMLGDALVYGFSLWVLARGARWKARAALAKAAVMAAFGLLVAGQVVYRIAQPVTPAFETIGVVGGLALAANLVCFGALWRHRASDINMRSVWLCSRNDLIGNTGVILAAALVGLTGSHWPDVAIGALICGVFLRSAWQVTREARAELRAAGLAAPEPGAPKPGAGSSSA